MVQINFEWQHQEIPEDDPDGLLAAAAERERLEFNLRYARAAAPGIDVENHTWVEVDADPRVVSALRAIEEHNLRMAPVHAARRERETAKRLAAGGEPCPACGVIVMSKDRYCRGCGVELAAT